MPHRDGPLDSIKVPLTWAAAAAVVLALAAGAALLFSDRRESLDEDGDTALRDIAGRIQAPVSGALSKPVEWVGDLGGGIGDYFGAVSENRRLRLELQAMNDLKAENASLRDENERYVALLGLRTDPPVEMVSARAVTDSRGPFANSRLVNVGSEAGVKVGNPVMSENGLVGRVVDVTEGVSRVLMLTDVASKVPVMLDRTNARSILTGDGGPNPVLDVLRGREPPRAGDMVVTSGDGGLMPRGLPVGVAVRGLDGAWRVRLASDLEPIDYVRILKFEGFVQSVDAEALASPVMPAQMAGGALVQPAPPATPAPTAAAATPP